MRVATRCHSRSLSEANLASFSCREVDPRLQLQQSESCVFQLPRNEFCIEELPRIESQIIYDALYRRVFRFTIPPALPPSSTFATIATTARPATGVQEVGLLEPQSGALCAQEVETS